MEEVKLLLFIDDTMQYIYIYIYKVPTKIRFELINELCEVARYDINILKSISFLYTNNELSEI